MKRLLSWIVVALLGTAGSAAPLRRVPARVPERAAPAARILVKFLPGAAAGERSRVMAARGVAAARILNRIDTVVIPVPAGKTAEQMVAELQPEIGRTVAYAEPDRVRYVAAFTPNDALFASQYYAALTGAPEAWESGAGTGVTIAIADTGVQVNHPDLAANLLPGFNVVDNTTDVSDSFGHGTLVAGAAAAVGENGIGIAGMAFGARILPIKITPGSLGFTFDSYIAEAITYAADNGARVVNVSFGSDSPAPGGCWTQTVLSAAAYMRSREGLVVFSAGNAGFDKGCANNTEITNVAATNATDQLAAFSNFGAELDISAPGDNIVSTHCNACAIAPGAGDYVGADGTSFAAPIVAGILGLIYAVDGTFTAEQAEQILFASASDVGPAGYDTRFGWGRAHAAESVSIAKERSALFQLQNLRNVYAYPNPWDTRRHSNRQITFANIPDGGKVKIFTLSGFWVQTVDAANGWAVWDMRNNSGDTIASGLYFYLAESPTGATARGKFSVIK